jgi:hypothetical protein
MKTNGGRFTAAAAPPFVIHQCLCCKGVIFYTSHVLLRPSKRDKTRRFKRRKWLVDKDACNVIISTSPQEWSKARIRTTVSSKRIQDLVRHTRLPMVNREMWNVLCVALPLFCRRFTHNTRNGAVGWGTPLQVGRSRVRLQIEILHWLNTSGCSMALVSTQPLLWISTRGIT